MKLKLLNGALFNVSWLLIVSTQSVVLAWIVAALLFPTMLFVARQLEQQLPRGETHASC